HVRLGAWPNNREAHLLTLLLNVSQLSLQPMSLHQLERQRSRRLDAFSCHVHGPLLGLPRQLQPRPIDDHQRAQSEQHGVEEEHQTENQVNVSHQSEHGITSLSPTKPGSLPSLRSPGSTTIASWA